jgi:hypothetical protein
VSPGRASGIPEPSQIWYGAVWNLVNGQPVRVTTGQLTWECHPVNGGPPVLLATPLTNINDQFSFVLEVPCETVPAGFTPSPDALQITLPPKPYAHTNLSLGGQPLFLVSPAQPAFEALRGQCARIDLSMVRLDVDSDQDGLPDWWEDLYCSGQCHPGDDLDGDGVSNLDEYKAGTNPLDPQSLFVFISISPHAAGGMRIEWASAQGKTYRIERSADLLSGFAHIASGLVATPPANSYHDATATTAGPFFYRIRLEP